MAELEFMDIEAVREQYSSGKQPTLDQLAFHLFPFHTKERDLDMCAVTAAFLNRLNETSYTGTTTPESMCARLRESTAVTIEDSVNDKLESIFSSLFFDENGLLLPQNSLMLMHASGQREQWTGIVAEYLVAVLADPTKMHSIVRQKLHQTTGNLNALEESAYHALEPCSPYIYKGSRFRRVVSTYCSAFLEDFEYLLSDDLLASRYLVPLVELYFFIYTLQTCLQLHRLTNGNRNGNTPVYYALDWEKTSQSRPCYEQGWRKARSAVQEMYAHVIVLDLLNRSNSDGAYFDYIDLMTSVKDIDSESKANVKQQLVQIAQLYCELMEQPSIDLSSFDTVNDNVVAQGIEYLFQNVKKVLNAGNRKAASVRYSGNFEAIARRFLKHRGSSGLMLNLTEELLIMITRIIMKDRAQLRLTDLFGHFRDRGIFLDEISQERVADYFERLNLIEKKSDSEESKYVTRVI